jgi:hypothetical protein
MGISSLLFVPMVSWRLVVDYFGMIAMACSVQGDNEASQHSDFDKISDLRGLEHMVHGHT